MVAKASPCSRSRLATLLTIVVLLACVGGATVATDSNTGKPETSEGRLLRGLQGNFVGTTRNDDESEERAIIDAMKQAARAAKKKFYQTATDKLFKKVKIKEMDGTLFQSEQFKLWETRVTKNFKQNTERAQASMVSTLTSRFGDEALAVSLVTAKQNSKSRPIATDLENAQLQNWESAGKTGDDVFKLLKLNDKGEKLFESPMAATWLAYLTKLNKKNPEEDMISSLKRVYDDEALAKVITGAQNSASTVVLANTLERALMGKWLDEGKTLDEIFTLLTLETKSKVNTNTPDAISQLEKRFGSSIKLAKVIAYAKKRAITEATKADATRLQDLQFKQWLAAGVTPNNIGTRVMGDVFDIRRTQVSIDYGTFYRNKLAAAT
ncbi:RxLR effector protein PSR2 [Phytophthora ramorum]|uniref:RxLR effector PexRD54 WY domain-containing protein n=1 Tax=Phytophthora ramorum TaxID=164328 RepID=H3GFA0_PHYRM|nr:RxLR effector protein PSR2 [Phytophthora ramorum]